MMKINMFQRRLPSAVFFSLVNLLMATDAQALQVALFMGATLCQWLDMMHQLGLGEPTLTLTPLTHRVAGNVAVPNPTPSLIIPLVVIVATGKVVVMPLHHLPMVFAVTALVVGQLWAATVSAWSLRFHGHSGSPRFRALKNLLGDCSLWRSSSFYFMIPF